MANALTTRKSRIEAWREAIAEQEQSGLPVREFCQRRGVSEQSFYTWRRRVREKEPVRFALVETDRSKTASEPLELVLRSGERLRIGFGVDAATLRTVLEVLRA